MKSNLIDWFALCGIIYKDNAMALLVKMQEMHYSLENNSKKDSVFDSSVNAILKSGEPK